MLKLAAVSGFIVFLGALAIWSAQPKSVLALERMSSEHRLTYLQNREASDLIGYYCGDKQLSHALEQDIEQVLRDHGVLSCESGLISRNVPAAP
ncbi:MAG: hypothetical protein AAF936_03980 [Pseudomonadota bacterium]